MAGVFDNWPWATGNKITRHASAFKLIKPHIVGTLCMIENAVISARIEMLTIRAILVQINALRLARAARNHFTQRRILIGKVLARIGAFFARATFDLWVIKTLLGLRIKKHWVLTQLDNQAFINTFKITAAAFGVNDSKLVHILGTFRSTIRVDLPITNLFIVSVKQSGLAQHHLVMSKVTEVICRAIVRIWEEACLIWWTFNGAIDFLSHLGYLQLIVLLCVLIVEFTWQCCLFNTRTIWIKWPNAISCGLVP